MENMRVFIFKVILIFIAEKTRWGDEKVTDCGGRRKQKITHWDATC